MQLPPAPDPHLPAWYKKPTQSNPPNFFDLTPRSPSCFQHKPQSQPQQSLRFNLQAHKPLSIPTQPRTILSADRSTMNSFTVNSLPSSATTSSSSKPHLHQQKQPPSASSADQTPKPQRVPKPPGRLLEPFIILLETGHFYDLPFVVPDLRLSTQERECLIEAVQMLKILSQYLVNHEFQKFQQGIITIMDALYADVECSNTVKDARASLRAAVADWRAIEREEREERYRLKEEAKLRPESQKNLGSEESTNTDDRLTERYHDHLNAEQNNTPRSQQPQQIEHATPDSQKTIIHHTLPRLSSLPSSLGSDADSEPEVFMANKVTLTRTTGAMIFTPLRSSSSSPEDLTPSPATPSTRPMGLRKTKRNFTREGGRMVARMVEDGREVGEVASRIPPTFLQELNISDGPMDEWCFQARVEGMLRTSSSSPPGLEGGDGEFDGGW